MQKDKAKQKVKRWSFEPSAATLKAYDEFLESMGRLGASVNKSKLLDALVLDGLHRETDGNKTGERKP